MNPGRATTRRFTFCLILSAVLILGIVQWSFLPVLIQNASLPGQVAVDVSPGHTSKFAAPSKFLLGNVLQPCLKQANLGVPQPTVRIFRPDEPSFRHDSQLSFSCQLRAPPSA
jgi:hypothetical protein